MRDTDEENGFLLQVAIESAERSRLPWNMLEHNQIPGFLPFQYYYRDDTVCFRYITGQLQPAAEYFEKRDGDFETLLFLCREIIEIVDRGEEYLLNQGEYVITPERIYWNRPERKVCLCYLPGNGGDFQRNYTALVEYLMKHTEHRDGQAAAFIYSLYDRLASDCFSMDGMKQYFLDYNQPAPVKKETGVRKKSPEKKYYLVYNGGAWKDIVFRGEGIREYPVPEQEEVFVGRDKGGDVVLPFPEISRQQAILRRRDQRFFLVDRDSANGTYLNDKMISGKEETPCREGDNIRFACHCFQLVCRR